MAAGEHHFSAKLIRPDGTGTWTYVEVPRDVSDAFGTRSRVPVAGTIAGVAFRGSMMPAGGGGHFVVVAKPIREKAGVTAGDTVEVMLRADTAPRPVEVPPELDAALTKNQKARERFEALAPSHRREYANWIAEAKKAETRISRAEKAIAMLLEGRKLKQ